MRKQAQEKLVNTFFLLILFIFINAFDFNDNPASGWYQQFLPSIGSGNIVDMTFTDSLNGYIVTDAGFGNNNYILKTTNGGDNWNITVTNNEPFVRIIFLNQNTGFTNAFQKLYKTTNAGVNWNIITLPGDIFGEDMFVLNEDTIWLVNSEGLTGGVFRTTNGGVNWVRQASFGSDNPDRIYMFNANIGFISYSAIAASPTRKTTNGGVSWFTIANEGFNDMHFADELTGWLAHGTMKKTTDGGLNWVEQPLPSTMYGISSISKISALNKDTIWGVGGYAQYPNAQFRGAIYTTTNGGTNWLYQVPDTNINIFSYYHIQFINKSCGWAYSRNKGIHTKVGGDPLTSINTISSEIPKQFKLVQNYPNPFNPNTIINYQLTINSFVTLKVFDLQGKEIQTLVNQKQNTGSYSVDFNGANLSSGIYFYTLQTENYKQTRKMMLVK